MALLAPALALVAAPNRIPAQQAPQVAIDNDDIGGVVRSPSGPEAGVWVIAETTELPTKFAKMVVTDDQGRYVIPDLPTANYSVWVRGYGLVDSPKVRAKPGQLLNLAAVPAPDAASGGALLPGDLLVHDDEDSAGEGFRRHHATSRRTSPRTPGATG